ncbi:MAG: UDP-N-acetylmuramoyl-L-alanine--D-glutamate ligase [Pseudomonadota bacterium]|nr:UDP-N-acetylmuramoyl-L-alanine--D-glutamate ligase [Pseudomonadota bacterium]
MSLMPNQSSHIPTYLIIGLGQTGLSCVRFLIKQGYTVTVMDTRETPPGLATLQTEYPEVIVHVGGLDSDWLQKADVIVISPGVDPRLPEIKLAREAGVELVGDIELFARYANAPIIAITGSNGKSTVTTLLAEMVEKSGQTMRVGGNLGTPALALICEPAPNFYIVELSSFQLETVSSLNAFASTVLNVSPDHLDRYDSVQDYQRAKAQVFNGDGVMVINRDDIIVNQLVRPGRNQIGFSLESSEGVDFGVINQNGKQWLAEGSQALISVEDLKIFGKHNIANALAALALGSAMGLSMIGMLAALKQYSGLPHRCRLVADNENIRWFNDSKATNVGASIAAIEGLDASRKIILIAGGEGKEQDFSALTTTLQQHVSAVILLGRDGKLIADVVPRGIETYYATTMLDAVTQARAIAQTGYCVLLSPACASFDMFSGYAERGYAFESAVMAVAYE